MIRQIVRKSVHKPSIPMSAIKAMPKDVRKDGRDHYYVGGYGRQQKMCLMPSRSASLTISSTSSSVSFSPIRWCRNSKMDYIWNVYINFNWNRLFVIDICFLEILQVNFVNFFIILIFLWFYPKVLGHQLYINMTYKQAFIHL